MTEKKIVTVALYERSSKDRNDVSVESQDRELRALAERSGEIVVAVFQDKIESAKDDNRPAFQKMMAEALSGKARFKKIYCYDTARFSRRQHLAQHNKRLLEVAGIKIDYLKLPKAEGSYGKMMISVSECFDELHSNKSREDGLRGMTQNVLNGYRAGGRAPYGYRLEREQVSANKNGAVFKSKLVPDPVEFPKVREFLLGRLGGQSRNALNQELNMNLSSGRMLYIERSALIYAGHTLWNRHYAPQDDMPTVKKERFKPREEWIVREGTHKAAISTEQAEAIMQGAELRRSRFCQTGRTNYVLSALLKCRCGNSMVGDAGYYRCSKKCGAPKIKGETIERTVSKSMVEDILSEEVFKEILREVQTQSARSAKPATSKKSIQQEINRLVAGQRKLTKLLVSVSNNRPLLEEIDEMEERRVKLEAELSKASEAVDVDIAKSANRLRKFLQKCRSGVVDGNSDKRRGTLRTLIERCVFNPKDRTVSIFPKIPGAGNRWVHGTSPFAKNSNLVHSPVSGGVF